MTAIVAPLLLLAGGFAVDYGYASYINQRLSQATDNAVLGSVSQSAATAGGGFSNTAWLQSYGTSIFNANIANLPISNVKFKLTVTPNGTRGVNSVGQYTYDYPTFFAGIIGINSMPLTSQIKASANPLTYIDYYILVDASQSMGVGATTTDMQNLYDRVVANKNGSGAEAGCVFGCHVIQSEQATAVHTNENLAHSPSFGPRINLRIDAAVAAIQSIISDAQTAAGTDKNIRIGIYMINRNPTKANSSPVDPNSYITTISPPSSDYKTLLAWAQMIDASASGKMDLGENIPQGAGDTDFSNELSYFSSKLPIANGDGSLATTPQNFVFIISDGLSDASNPSACGSINCHPTKPISINDCNVVKARANVGTIYTTYNPIYLNNVKGTSLANPNFEPNFKNLVSQYLSFDNNLNVVGDQMRDALKSCSTDPKYAFEAKDGPSINTAMRALFASTLQNARLTQ